MSCESPPQDHLASTSSVLGGEDNAKGRAVETEQSDVHALPPREASSW